MVTTFLCLLSWLPKPSRAHHLLVVLAAGADVLVVQMSLGLVLTHLACGYSPPSTVLALCTLRGEVGPSQTPAHACFPHALCCRDSISSACSVLITSLS